MTTWEGSKLRDFWFWPLFLAFFPSFLLSFSLSYFRMMVWGGGTAIVGEIISNNYKSVEQRLNLSRSQQQGHSATYNTLFII